ncbi:MAG: ribosome-associated translation inhibitor RaiA [Caldilineaceae bacterium]
MNLIVNGRNVEITEWIEEYVEKKLAKIERHVTNLGDVRAELTQSDTRSNNDRYTFQITLRNAKRILRAEEISGDIFASIDAAIEKLSRQLDKVEGRRKNRRRTSIVENTEAVLAVDGGELDEQAMERIVRRKQFMLQPMNEEEAQEQLELLGHDFYLFFNPDFNAVNLIYRRKDGHYGLLQPQM